MSFQLFFDEPALIQVNELYDIDSIPYIPEVRGKLHTFLDEGDLVTVVFALHVELDDDEDDVMEVQKVFQIEITKINSNEERQYVGKLIKIIDDNGRCTDRFYKPGELISCANDHIYQIPLKEHLKVLKKKVNKE